MNKIIILSASDSDDLVNEIKKRLTIDGIEILINPADLPESWDPVVILFPVTEEALKDHSLLAYLNVITNLDLPIVPVVQNLAIFNFNDIPDSHSMIKDRNTVGLETEDGITLVDTVQGYLGLSAFTRNKKVFISYRRSDAESIAKEIRYYLSDNDFQVFLDTLGIAGGAVVQEEIVQELEDKDFVLLLDSPDIVSSKWVEEEILYAFAKRIPICAVTIGAGSGLEIIRDIKRINWPSSKGKNKAKVFKEIRLMISRAIASRESLSKRVGRTVGQAIKLKSLSSTNLAKRQVLLRRRKKQVLLEYENASISLERLHRLYLGYKQQKGCNIAIYICGDYNVHKLTNGAIKWARGRCSLEVLPLAELYSFLDQVFA